MGNLSIGLIYDVIRWEEKSIMKAIEAKGAKLIPVDAKSVQIDITKREREKNFGDAAIQRCIGYFRALHMVAALENKGVLVVNPYRVISTCGNKLFVTLALAKAGVPTPHTVLAFTPESVLKYLEEVNYQAVLKPVVGSWGRLLAPLKDRESAEAILEDREFMHPLYQVYYVQELIKRPPRDIRVTVIGDEVVAAIYRISAPGAWKTNLAIGGKAEECKLTSEMRELALKAAKAVGGGVLGIDMMESEDKGLLVHEVNHTVEFMGTVSITKKDVPGKIVDYVIKQAKK